MPFSDFFFYHYKGPRQTKLSGVIPCQKFFGEPVLITTFVLSDRFYHRSKKDVIRLSMTTVTDVDCFNIITIRLSIDFGDCMQSAEVKSNMFYAIFSSTEPLGSQGDNTVPEGGSVNMRGPEKFFHKWLETCLEYKKIEGDWLESWRFRRNPRWPPRWRLFLSKMPVPL